MGSFSRYAKDLLVKDVICDLYKKEAQDLAASSAVKANSAVAIDWDSFDWDSAVALKDYISWFSTMRVDDLFPDSWRFFSFQSVLRILDIGSGSRYLYLALVREYPRNHHDGYIPSKSAKKKIVAAYKPFVSLLKKISDEAGELNSVLAFARTKKQAVNLLPGLAKYLSASPVFSSELPAQKIERVKSMFKGSSGADS